MKKNTFTIPFARKTSFLIGDSPIHGKDQILSNELRYNKHGLYDATNEHRINDAKAMAKDGHFFNIRIVTVFEDAICIPQGIIGHKKRKETQRPFDLFSNKKRTWF